MNTLVVVCFAVVALTYFDASVTGMCLNVCPYGILPGCVCREPGSIIIPTCDLMHCGVGSRCAVIGTSSMCVPMLSAVYAGRCSLPLERGLCRTYMSRYYYNAYTRSCLPFTYGGCGGNANRYMSPYACRMTCGGI